MGYIDNRKYEHTEVMSENFPVLFSKFMMTFANTNFQCHWHEKLEFLYFINGEALIKCNSKDIYAKEGDLVVINSNELHQGFCVSEPAIYYCIVFDTSLFENRSVDLCQAKYINAINENRILFKNRIENDKDAAKFFMDIVNEYELKKTGYEMAIKAAIYNLLVLLLRNYAQVELSPDEYESRVKNLNRFNVIFKYIEEHYNEKITIDKLCSLVNLSRFYFCRIFKNLTGKSLSHYLNILRIDKAEAMLKSGKGNITETAMACGFESLNYFSSLFKEYKNVTPSSLLKENV